MKANSIPTVDRVFRGVVLAMGVFLLDVHLVLLVLPLTEITLVLFGVPRFEAIQSAVETPLITVPVVLLANVGLIVALRLKKTRPPSTQHSPDLNTMADTHSKASFGLC